MDFSSLGDILAIWREISRITVFTGLSGAALAACGAALWFGWQISVVRHLAIIAMTTIVVGYVAGVHFYGRGLADKQAEWDAAEVRAAAAAQKRDADQAQASAQDAAQQIAQLQQQAQQDQETINALRTADGACHPITPDELR